MTPETRIVRAWYGEAQAFVEAAAVLIQQALASPLP